MYTIFDSGMEILRSKSVIKKKKNGTQLRMGKFSIRNLLQSEKIKKKTFLI